MDALGPAGMPGRFFSRPPRANCLRMQGIGDTACLHRHATAPLDSRLNRLWAHEQASYGLRILAAFSALLAVCWARGELQLLPSLFLGAIASALAETDDNARGRAKAVLLSLASFAAIATMVITLAPYPWLFIAALAAAAFALVLLGALGERYASLGQSTVLLALYAMIGLEPGAHGGPWQHVALMLAGATWYGALSVLWALLLANRPVRERLARLFLALERYLQLKADLFEPVFHGDLEARRLALAQQNVQVVAALESARAAILSRFGYSGRPGVQSGLYFRLYYMAQDFHERASSSHYPYQALAEAFFHSDVLYRCRRVLLLQAGACAALGHAIRLRQPFAYPQSARQAGQDLRQSLDYLRAHHNPQWLPLLGALQLLGHNLASIERQLSDTQLVDAPLDGIDTRLRDTDLHSLREIARRLWQQLDTGSPLFRHGVRIASVLLAGFLLLRLVHPDNGYWILITSVVVCRPYFGATRRLLAQRIAGTLLGLAATWALMQLFPATWQQLLLALAATVAYFIARRERYVLATLAITVMALLCFNLIGNGYMLLWPRLLDTLLGALIAVAGALLVLPDWQGRHLPLVMANIVGSCARYLDAVLDQYRHGMRDDLPYRIARRDMHNADVALSMALSHMLHEPGYARGNLDAGFRFLALANTLLGYLSALGAHRAHSDAVTQDAAITAAGARLQQELAEFAQALQGRQPPEEPMPAYDTSILEPMAHDLDPRAHLLRTQLTLILQLLPRLRAVAREASSVAPPGISPPAP